MKLYSIVVSTRHMSTTAPLVNMANSFILLIVTVTFASQSFTVAAEDKWEKYRVVPDVIPTAPVATAEIQYGDREANLGNELTPSQTHNQPTVDWPTEEGAYYTLFMNDPDVPKQIAKEFQHWIVFNIPGSEISKGDMAFSYYGPGPPQQTGFHRYIFLIYKQNGLIGKKKFSDIKDANQDSRKQFILTDLLQRFNFKNPVAGNFFRAKYEKKRFTRQASQAEDIKKMEEYRIVPDVIPNSPKARAEIKYGDQEVIMGNELTPTQVHEKPTISWPTEEGAYYSLFMNDPDVPKQIAKEVQHWLVFNIPGNEIAKGDTTFDYIGAGPPLNTGLHRYIFLIYKQDGLIEKDKFSDLKETTVESRRKYVLTDLIKRFNFKDPVAGNFFRAQYDENVPKYYVERLKKFEKS